jgi:hypothetical protein
MIPRVVPKLIGAFDASGKEDTPCLVVAGFVSSPTDWKLFDAQWTGRLKEDGIHHFHMCEFAHSVGQFATGWKEDETRRQRLFRDLIQIIQSNVYRKFSSSVEMDSFSRLSAENRRAYALNAYSLACRGCAADIRNWQKSEKFVVPTAYVFEDGDAGRGLVTKRFQEDGLPPPSFKGKKDFSPLQAADILAYELHKPHRDMLAGKPRIKQFRFGLQELNKIPGEPSYYSPKNLQELQGYLSTLA